MLSAEPLEIQIRSAENRIQVLETLLSKDDGETLVNFSSFDLYLYET